MQGTFIIIRDDLQVDPATIVAEGLLAGRLPTCELLLNHPSVSRLHAGITATEGEYYIRNLRPANPIMLNGKPLEQYEALTDGDVLGVGPFSLNIDFKDDALRIKVSLQIGATPGEAVARDADSGMWDLPTTMNLEFPVTPTEGQPAEGAHKKPPPRKPKPAGASSKALDVFWDKRITAATKTVRPSPLFPMTGRAAGKAQSVWAPTSDLKRRWPISLLVWGTIVVALLSAAGALFYAKAFAPAPIADVHTRTKMVMSPPIGHAEHRGAQFSAIGGALLSCAECHTDSNKHFYNGKRVSTPHGGTFGYPVVDGHWKWTGIDEQEMAVRKATLKLERLPTDSEDQWRSKQFHAVHLYRVRAIAGLPGNKDGELSCSSCHAMRDPIDLTTPRTTCAKCHNGQSDPRAGRQVIAADKPNCTSCHVQHVKDKRHWNPGLLAMN